MNEASRVSDDFAAAKLDQTPQHLDRSSVLTISVGISIQPWGRKWGVYCVFFSNCGRCFIIAIISDTGNWFL